MEPTQPDMPTEQPSVSEPGLVTPVPQSTSPKYSLTGHEMLPTWAIIAACVVGLCMLCGLCSAVGGLANQNTQANGNQSTAQSAPTFDTTLDSSAPSTDAAVATDTPTPTPTPVPPTPTPTPNPNAGLAAYNEAIQPDTQTLSTDMSNMGTDCSAGAQLACYTDLQVLVDDVHQFQSDLDAHPAPPCLKTADTYLRAALKQYDQGAQLAMNGIDQGDASMIKAGSNDLQAGTDDMSKATAAVKTAHC